MAIMAQALSARYIYGISHLPRSWEYFPNIQLLVYAQKPKLHFVLVPIGQLDTFIGRLYSTIVSTVTKIFVHTILNDCIRLIACVIEKLTSILTHLTRLRIKLLFAICFITQPINGVLTVLSTIIGKEG